MFLPVEGDLNSGSALAALTLAMQQLSVVAVVRKVYRQVGNTRVVLHWPILQIMGKKFKFPTWD